VNAVQSGTLYVGVLIIDLLLTWLQATLTVMAFRRLHALILDCADVEFHAGHLRLLKLRAAATGRRWWTFPSAVWENGVAGAPGSRPKRAVCSKARRDGRAPAGVFASARSSDRSDLRRS